MIRVKVLVKSEIKTWRTAAASGELFTVDLEDVDGTRILGSFLNKQVLKFYPEISEGKQYHVSKGTIKRANKRVTSITNDYCIAFADNTEFTEVTGEFEKDYTTDFEKSLVETGQNQLKI